MVANPARGQLNRENAKKNLSPFVPENLVSRDGFGRLVRVSLLILHTQAESGAFLPLSAAATIHLFIPPTDIRSVPSLSGHAIAYRWRSLLRVRRHKASSPQGSS